MWPIGLLLVYVLILDICWYWPPKSLVYVLILATKLFGLYWYWPPNSFVCVDTGHQTIWYMLMLATKLFEIFSGGTIDDNFSQKMVSWSSFNRVGSHVLFLGKLKWFKKQQNTLFNLNVKILNLQMKINLCTLCWNVG